MTENNSTGSKPVKLAPEKKEKRKLKPGMGKAKGSGFEGTIAKKLTTALQPLNFMRTPGSGARVGGKNFATLGQMLGEDALKIFVGDVVPVNERQEGITFRYSVECKFYATPDGFTALASGNANVYKWFEEAVVDASKINKRAMLVFKWNHTDTFACVDEIDADLQGKYPPLFSILTQQTATRPARCLAFYRLDDLLASKDFWIK